MYNPRTNKVKRILHSDWLPERARWDHLASSGFPALVPQGKSYFLLYNKSFIDQVCSVKRAVYWPHSFLCVNKNYDKILKVDWLSTVLISALIDFDFTSLHNYAKRTWPMTSHIGQTLVNNVLRSYYHSTNGT